MTCPFIRLPLNPIKGQNTAIAERSIYQELIMELLNYDVSLLVFHSTMSIDEISDLLGLKPIECHSRQQDGRPWIFRFDPQKGLPLTECIENIAESISAKRALFDDLYSSVS